MCALYRFRCRTSKPDPFYAAQAQLQEQQFSMNQASNFPGRFDGRSEQYLRWQEDRLQQQQRYNGLQATLLSPTLEKTDDQALARLCSSVQDYGFALYQWSEASDNPDRDVSLLHAALSLRSFDRGVVHEDSGLSLLTDLSGTDQGKFIPYTSRRMGWHTDGYYNTMDQSLHCFTLHCISPAHSGGALTLLDHQLVLIELFNEDPALVDLLSHPQAMMLPANRDELGHDRPERYSPVLFVRTDGTPGAHFTTRTKHIHWRTPDTLDAAQQMKKVIERLETWQCTVKLNAGQGLITRNVLHQRDAYTDHPDAPRKMLRGRYLQSPQHPFIKHDDHGSSPCCM